MNECRGSSIFKIRELAAKALVSILQKSLDNFEKLASKITPEVCAKITTNQRHGNLLQVSHNNTPSSSLKKNLFITTSVVNFGYFQLEIFYLLDRIVNSEMSGLDFLVLT